MAGKPAEVLIIQIHVNGPAAVILFNFIFRMQSYLLSKTQLSQSMQIQCIFKNPMENGMCCHQAPLKTKP